MNKSLDEFKSFKDRIKKIKSIPISKFLDSHGLSGIEVEDKDGAKAKILGVTPFDDKNHFDLSGDVRDAITDYMPILSTGDKMYATQLTGGADSQLNLFIKNLTSILKTFNQMGTLSDVFEQSINYDKMLNTFYDQDILKILSVKQEDKYLLVGYFDKGPLLTENEVEDLFQVFIDGDFGAYVKSITPWVGYKISHDALYYTKLLSHLKEVMMTDPYQFEKIKRVADKVSTLSSSLVNNSIYHYTFVY